MSESQRTVPASDSTTALTSDAVGIETNLEADIDAAVEHGASVVTERLPGQERGYGKIAARGAGLAMGAQAVRLVFQTVSLAVLARFLTPHEFGLIASVTAIAGVADILRDFGLSQAAIQSKTLSDDERTNLFWANFGLGSLCAVILAACAPLISRAYGDDSLTPVTWSLASLFVITGAATQFNANLTRNLRFKALIGAELSGYVCSIGIAIALAALGAGHWALVAQLISAVLISLTVSVSCNHWRPRLWRRGVSLKRFFKFGRNVLGTQLIAYATMNVDNIALGVHSGPNALGIYSRAYQLLMLPLNQINRAVSRVALPILARVQDDLVVFDRYLQKAQLIGAYITATVFALVTGLSEPIVRVLFGSQWNGVIPVLAILAAGGVFRAISQVPYLAYLTRGQTRAQFRLYLITRPPMIGMMIAGLPWGAIGVAVGSTVAYTLYWIVSLVHSGRMTGIDSMALLRGSLRSVLFVNVPVGLLAYMGVLLVNPPVLQLCVGGALAAIYLALVGLFVPSIRADLGTVIHFAKRSVRR